MASFVAPGRRKVATRVKEALKRVLGFVTLGRAETLLVLLAQVSFPTMLLV